MSHFISELAMLTEQQFKVLIACAAYWRVYDIAPAPAAKDIARITDIGKKNVWDKAHALVRRGLLDGFKWKPTAKAELLFEQDGILPKLRAESLGVNSRGLYIR